MKRRWIILLAGILALDVGIGYWWWHRWSEDRYDNVIHEAATRYDIPPELLKALVWKESRFDSQARGRAGEYGLMQIRDAAAYEWAASEHRQVFHPVLLLDPSINIQVGSWYLKKLMRRYANSDNPVVYALADYNAGRANVLRWYKGDATTNSTAFQRAMDFPTTAKYISEILQKQRDYRDSFEKVQPKYP